MLMRQSMAQRVIGAFLCASASVCVGRCFALPPAGALAQHLQHPPLIRAHYKQEKQKALSCWAAQGLFYCTLACVISWHE